MKIAIVCDLLSTFLRFRRFLALDMINRGHEVVVFASRNDLEDAQFFSDHSIGVEIVRMDRTGLNPFADWKYLRQLKKSFSEFKPDHILAYQAKAAVWSAIAGRSVKNCRVSILFPGLGYLFSLNPSGKQKLVQTLSRPLYRFAFAKIDNAIFQNSDDIETLRQAKVLSDATHVVEVNGSGVCLEEFAFSIPPTSPMRFVMATRLLADKGIREFADAAAELKKKFGDSVEFQIAGGLDNHPMAIRKKEIDAWEKAGSIRYPGHVSDMVEFLTNSSVFVLPSYYMEGTPRSILEAMAIGRAIITTDNRGCRETVEDGLNGFLVEQRDIESLQQAMEKLILNPQVVVDMGQKSREIAERKYDVKLVCQQMLDAMDLK